MNPVDWIHDLYKPGDYIVFKLDIDNDAVEGELIQQVLAMENAGGIIAEMFFEKHYSAADMKMHFRAPTTTVPGRPAADARAEGKGGARPLVAVKYEEVVLNVRARSSNKPCRVLQMLSGLATHLAISVPEKAMLAFSHRKSNAHPPPVLGDPGLGAVSPGVGISWPESNKRLAQHAWARPAAGGKDGLAQALAGSQVTAPLARQQVHCPRWHPPLPKVRVQRNSGPGRSAVCRVPGWAGIVQPPRPGYIGVGRASERWQTTPYGVGRASCV